MSNDIIAVCADCVMTSPRDAALYVPFILKFHIHANYLLL